MPLATTLLKNTALDFNIKQVHKPVLLNEVLHFLEPKKNGIYLDATLGLGGHSEAILKNFQNIKLLVGMDWDEEALDLAKKRLAQFKDKTSFYLANFKDLNMILEEENIEGFDGILMDLGLSSYQLDQSGRGFSFMRDEPLDMRMDRSGTVLASDMINKLPEERLEKLIRFYGEEPWAKKIAKEIVKKRGEKPILSTSQLANIVKEAIPKKFHPRKIHPATKTFQAIRIAINREFENLTTGLEKAVDALKPDGRILVISFHSLEDRIVKHFFKKNSQLEIITKKPIRPTKEEITKNPRARSAKLRVAQKRHKMED